MKNDSPHSTRLVQRAPLELLRPFLAKQADTLCDEGSSTNPRTASSNSSPAFRSFGPRSSNSSPSTFSAMRWSPSGYPTPCRVKIGAPGA